MNSIKIFFAGDFCSKSSTSKISISDELKSLIQSCDLKVVNFEVPLRSDVTLPPQLYERFYQNDDAPVFLRNIGFNLFSIANNHAFDWGVEGFKKTKAALGDAAFGAGTYDDAYKVKICDIKGVKIGFLALSYAAYTGVFNDVLHRDGLGCAYINDLRVNHDIMEAKKIVDYLFVLPHDGIEYIDVPLPETIARYRDFIDYGADGVIASHPHCPQGWEEYKGKPIFYSLGNFLFNSKDGYDYRATNRPHWYDGLCVVLEVDDIKKGDIRHKLINTKNENNVFITIDNSPERKKHNIDLQNYLSDQVKYKDYLNNCLPQIVKKVEMPVILNTIYCQDLISLSKAVIKKMFRKKHSNNKSAFSHLLKNDLRKNLLMRFFNSN